MKTLTRTRLIGYLAMIVCVIGYGGFGVALLLGKMDVLSTTHSMLLAAVAAVIGEIGLWVGAACLGLTLFKKRKAMLDKLFRRAPKPAASAAEV